MAIIDAPFQNPARDPARNVLTPMVAFSMRQVFPGQVLLTTRHSGVTSAIGRGPARYEGYCTWRAQGDAAGRELAAFFARMQGYTHQARIYLPRTRYAPQTPPPSGLSVVVASSAVNMANHTLAITLTVAGGAHVIQAGDHVNIGNRLYHVITSATDAINVLPMAVPADGATISMANPFLIVRAAAADQGDLISTGWRDRDVTFDWVESV